MKFKKIAPESYSEISDFIYNSSICNCGLLFANLCSWANYFNSQYALSGEGLIIRMGSKKQWIYHIPIVKMSLKGEEANKIDSILSPLDAADTQKMLEAVSSLKKYTDEHREHLIMVGVNENKIDAIRDKFEYIKIESNRDYEDYVYRRSTLQDLKGKSLQPKRNHINKFKKLYPDWRFETFDALTVTPEILKQCKNLETKWSLNHTESSSTIKIEEEKSVVDYAIRNFRDLDMLGGVLYIDNKAIAFTMGGKLNDFIFDVMIEKGDKEYQGCFPMINQQFIQSLPEEYLLINREEDLGVEGLRKSKISYNPHLLIKKYSIEFCDAKIKTFPHDLSLKENPCEGRNETDAFQEIKNY